MSKEILLIICFLFLLIPSHSFSQRKNVKDSGKIQKLEKNLDSIDDTRAQSRNTAKEHKKGLFGISNDDWLIILIILIIIETILLILIASKYKGIEKEKKKIESDLSECFIASLQNIPISFDPKNIPGIPEQITDFIEEKIKLLSEKDYTVVELHTKLGNVEYAKGNIKSALSIYEKALEQAIKQNYMDIRGICLSNIGQIYIQKGELDIALKYLLDAFATHKKAGYKHDEASHLSNIGLVYLLKEEYNLAIEYLTKAIELKPDIEKLYDNRGLAYHKINEKENAQKDFDKAKELKNAGKIS